MAFEHSGPSGGSSPGHSAGDDATEGAQIPDKVARRTVDGALVEWVLVPEAARQLDLSPHPEGGWFKRTWESDVAVATSNGQRPTATMIHFFLPAGECSAWHRVTADEIWLWHGPGKLVLELGGIGEVPEPAQQLLLGPAVLSGERQQGVVPAGVWQRTLPSDTDVLVSCVVSPGFSFDDWTLA